MKKDIIKKLLCSILVLSFVFGLVGCNKNEAKSKQNTQLAKQNVYSYEKIPFEIESEDYNVKSMTYMDGKVIVCIEVYIYDEQNESSESRTDIYSAYLDGSDFKKVELHKEAETDDTEHSYINQLILAKDGSVLAIEDTYKDDYSDPDNPISENWMNLKCWNADGTQRWVKNMDEFKTIPEDYFYISNMFVDDEGKIYLICNDSQTKFLSLDRDGNVIGNNLLDDSALTNVSNVYMKSDKTFMILSYDDSYTKQFASIYDPIANTMGEKKEIVMNLGMYNMTTGTTTDFILYDNVGIYSYNIGDTEVTPIMNIVNSDLGAAGFSNVSLIDDTQFVASYRDLVDYKDQLAIFTKVNPEDIPDKEVLVIGVNYLGSDVAKRIIDFNKENETYRITVRDYSTSATMEDYMASYTARNNDIISGNMPDMLIADMQMPISDYVSKGLLADIGKLIEEDEELSQKVFMEKVFKAYSINDKLYNIIPSFSIETALAKESIVGERTGWTMDDMLKIQSELPEDASIFSNDTTRASFLMYILACCGSDFIDVSTGKCKFDSDEFIKILEFAKTLPEEQEDLTREGMIRNVAVASSSYVSNWEDYESQFRNNKTIVSPNNIYNVASLNRTINGNFGGDFSFVGYPNENSNGSVIQNYTSYVISAKSPNIDGAWEFLRYYLTDEYQTTQWDLPVNREIFLAKAQEAMERPYYMDFENNKIEYDETIYINDEEVILEPMTQEQVNKVVSFIENVERQYYNNTEVSKIIDEEAASFFSGQKDAKAVAEIIQNRVQLYVNERR